MNTIKVTILSIMLALTFSGVAQSEDAPLKGVKLGFGFDKGFGITGAINNLSGFVGNKGVAVDYIFKKDTLKIEVNAPVYWYVGGGGFIDWDGDFGARLPVGVEIYLAKQLDAYVHLIPRFRVNNNDKNNNSDFGLDAGIGVRYQF